jgi:hypothetical protein
MGYRMTVLPVTRRPTRHHHPVANRCVLAVLRSPLHRLLDPGLVELRFTGRRSGVPVALPVMYARTGGRTVILVGDARAKTWWGNFATPHPVQIRRGGTDAPGVGRVLRPGDDGYLDAARVYTARHGLVPQSSDRLLVIDVPKGPTDADR